VCYGYKVKGQVAKESRGIGGFIKIQTKTWVGYRKEGKKYL
jgi:hypothetical protein